MQTARGAPLIDSDITRSPADDPAATSAEERPPRRRTGLLALVATVILVADVLTKVWVVATLGSGRVIELFGGYVLLHEVRNPGAAFSKATGATLLLSLVAGCVVVVIVRTARRLRSGGWAVCLGLLLGGATGNLVDRLLRSPGPLRGHVVDFVDFRWWPVFNVADSAIVTGGLLAVLLATRGIEIDGSHTHRSTHEPDA
jgi:lipoprotein signal peptidase